MANPKPSYKYPKTHKEELAKEMVGARLPLYLDEYVRSQPSKAEWLRKAVAAQYMRDMQEQNSTCT